MGDGDSGTVGDPSDSPVGPVGSTSTGDVGDVSGDVIGDVSLDGVTITGDPTSSLGIANGDIGLEGLFSTDLADTNSNTETGTFSTMENILNIIKGNPVAMATLAALTHSNPVLSGIVGIANIAANMNSNPIGSIMGNLGSTLGNAIAGPIGGVIGGSAGGSIGTPSGVGVTGVGSDPSASAGENMTDYMKLLPGLGSLYLQNKSANQFSGMASNLASLYGQDSPYSQMLRQQLTRQDAAGGRRSQYGTREVELQAKLAQLNSQNAPQIAQFQNAALQRRAQQLMQLSAMYRSPEGQKIGGAMGSGLQNMYYDAMNSYNSPDYSSMPTYEPTAWDPYTETPYLGG
jgi:hypothetical protein